MKKIIIFLLITVALIPAVSFAQKNKTKIKSAKILKPVLNISLGGMLDSSQITVADALKIIGLPLQINDTKKALYPVSSYQFMYIKKGVTEDEQNGKVTPITSNVSATFKQSPLSAIWIKTIYEQVKAGEELFFFDIIVKDAKGKLFYAPNLRLLVR